MGITKCSTPLAAIETVAKTLSFWSVMLAVPGNGMAAGAFDLIVMLSEMGWAVL